MGGALGALASRMPQRAGGGWGLVNCLGAAFEDRFTEA